MKDKLATEPTSLCAPVTHRASDTYQMGWALKEGVKGIFVIGQWPNFFSREMRNGLFFSS